MIPPDATILRRWGASLLFVLALHAAAYVALNTGHPARSPDPEVAFMIDMAAEPPPEPEPEPEPGERTPPPEPAPEPMPESPPPDATPEPPPPPPLPRAVVLPPPPPPAAARPKPVVRHDMQPAPPSVTPPQAEPAERPVAVPDVSSRVLTWEGKLGAYLLRFRRYPPDSLRRGDQGIVTMRLIVARNGEVRRATIVSGSGFDALDNAAREWIARASPVPAFPDDMPGTEIGVVVPFRFTLR